MKNEIEKLLTPGELSIDGFLGKDSRSIEEIIAEDKAEFAELGITIENVIMKLEELEEKGKDIMEREKTVLDRYTVKVRDDRGPMPNPTGGKPLRKGDITIKDTKSGKSLRYNDLTILMLKEFGFCSGTGSEYRLEPAILKEVLF